MQELGQAPYSFTVFASLGWVAFFLLIGVILRTFIPFCRKYLIPACMIGGLIGAIFTNTGLLKWAGPAAPDYPSLQMIIYHMYNLTFICFGLAGFGGGASKAPKHLLKRTTWLSFLTTSCTYIQCAIGILLIAGWNFIFDTNLLESVGHLMDKGFSSGPGAAMATGAAWEQAGFSGMISLGLAFAATGYIASLVFGVPVATYILKKKNIENKLTLSLAEQRGIYNEGECPPAGKMRFMTSNVDTMAFQAALILLGYLLSFAFTSFIQNTFPIPAKIMGMIWSLFAVLVCLPMGIIIREVVLKRVFHAQELFDPACNTRLLNILVDFIAVAALVGIEIAVVKEWLGILIIGSILCGVFTVAYHWFMCRKNIDYAEERFLGLVGLSTGTITSGLVLIRMVDSEYKSTVPYELGLMGLPSLLFSLPLMPLIMPLMFSQVYYGGHWTTPLIACTLVAISFTVIALLPFWKMNGKVAKF